MMWKMEVRIFLGFHAQANDGYHHESDNQRCCIPGFRHCPAKKKKRDQQKTHDKKMPEPQPTWSDFFFRGWVFYGTLQ